MLTFFLLDNYAEFDSYKFETQIKNSYRVSGPGLAQGRKKHRESKSALICANLGLGGHVTAFSAPHHCCLQISTLKDVCP